MTDFTYTDASTAIQGPRSTVRVEVDPDAIAPVAPLSAVPSDPVAAPTRAPIREWRLHRCDAKLPHRTAKELIQCAYRGARIFGAGPARRRGDVRDADDRVAVPGADAGGERLPRDGGCWLRCDAVRRAACPGPRALRRRRRRGRPERGWRTVTAALK